MLLSLFDEFKSYRFVKIDKIFQNSKESKSINK